MPNGACLGACDCGDVRFTLLEWPTSVKACDCSFCGKLGVLWSYCPPDRFRIDAGTMADYVRGEKLIVFRFCPRCACMVHWEALPDRGVFADGSSPVVGVNARLIEGLDLRTLARIE